MASGGDQHHAGHADDGDVRTRLGDGVAVGIGLLQCGDRVGEGLLRGVDVSLGGVVIGEDALGLGEGVTHGLGGLLRVTAQIQGLGLIDGGLQLALVGRLRVRSRLGGGGLQGLHRGVQRVVRGIDVSLGGVRIVQDGLGGIQSLLERGPRILGVRGFLELLGIGDQAGELGGVHALFQGGDGILQVLVGESHVVRGGVLVVQHLLGGVALGDEHLPGVGGVGGLGSGRKRHRTGSADRTC